MYSEFVFRIDLHGDQTDVRFDRAEMEDFGRSHFRGFTIRATSTPSKSASASGKASRAAVPGSDRQGSWDYRRSCLEPVSS
jgi:hypothetical protein